MTTPNNVTPISNASSWATSNTTGTQPYNPNSFYCTSKDADGSESMRIKVPTWVVRELASLSNSSDFPTYKSTSDVVRDALVHRVHYLKDNLATSMQMRMVLQEAMMLVLAEQRVLDVKIRVDRAERYLETVLEQMERNNRLELWDLQADLIHDARLHIDTTNWTGQLYLAINKHLDHFESMVPQEFRRPY